VGIGPQAPVNLSGSITGIGIVDRIDGSGSWNYNNFLITSISNTVTLPPTLTAAPISQENYAGGGVSFAVNASGTALLLTSGKPTASRLPTAAAFPARQLRDHHQEHQQCGCVDYSVIVSNFGGYF